jgi:5'-deoxynucleotidase YfbR-like HD superfamily hydrolase
MRCVALVLAVLVHCHPPDLPEVYAGDTNTARGLSPFELEEKAGREALAMERLRDELGDSPVLALLERYEAQEEPEARLVRYLDKVTPKLTHRLNRGRALAAMDLAAADVYEKHATQGAQLAKQYPEMVEVRRLFSAACELVEQAIRCGEMTVAEGRAPVC